MGDQHIELVVNRFEARKTEFDDERVTKALGLEPKWRIPNDYAAVHRSLNTGIPLISGKIAGRPGASRHGAGGLRKTARRRPEKGLGSVQLKGSSFDG